MGLVHGLAVFALSIGALQGTDAEPDILALLEADDETSLLEEIRDRPDDVRAALAELLRLSIGAAHADGRVQRLLQAERLAELYERAWSDSFLIHTVEQFRRWSVDERVQKLQADSLRRAGVEAYYHDGPGTAIRIWERSLGQYRALGDEAGQAAALGNLGAGYYALGRLDRALQYHTRSLEVAGAAGDERTAGNALGNIASVYKDQGQLALAAEYYGRALEMRSRTGDRRGEAIDLNNLGLVRKELGDLKGAEMHFRRALELNREVGRPRGGADNLTNLANTATQRGRYDEALDLYTEALTLRREVGDRRGEALDLENLGLLHLRWGDYPSALRSLEESLSLLEEIGPASWRAEVRSDIAAVHAAMGELRTALEELERAESEAGDDDYLAAQLALQRAELLTELNDFEPAVTLYRQARSGFERLEDDVGQADAEQRLGYLYLVRGSHRAAEEALTRALLIQERLEDPRPAALTRILLGDVQFAQGDSAAARDSYRRALAVHQALGDVAAEAATLGALADLDRELGALAAAEATYREALHRLQERSLLPIRWHLHLGLGLTLRGRGKLELAAEEFRAAVAQVETLGGTLSVEERRYGYFEDKWNAYAELARTELALGRVASAFELSERMRARQLADLLARGRTGAATADPGLIREEENLRRRIGELTRQLESEFASPSSLRGTETLGLELEELREQRAAAQAEYERLLVRLKESRPDYAALVSGTAASVGEVQQLLPNDAVLIEYLVQDEWSMAFVASKEEVAAVDLALDGAALRQLVELYRGALGRAARGLDDDLWRTPLRRLYRDLIAPLEAAGYLDGRRLLVIAPHAELHYLPFQALLVPGPQGEAFLIESYDIAYVPSASVWTQLSRRDRRSHGQRLLAMAPQPEALINSAAEVEGISRGARGAKVLIGEEATERRFRELAPDHDILHLATSGVLNRRNPLFSYVRLNGGREFDGRLEVHEVFGLHVSADLVVLSACETGLGAGLLADVPAGDDWVGLVRAFLYAGAESVVASLWAVDDEATARLMERFYAGLRAGQSKSIALAGAQRALIAERGAGHPFYWAAFVLTGNVD